MLLVTSVSCANYRNIQNRRCEILGRIDTFHPKLGNDWAVCSVLAHHKKQVLYFVCYAHVVVNVVNSLQLLPTQMRVGDI